MLRSFFLLLFLLFFPLAAKAQYRAMADAQHVSSSLKNPQQIPDELFSSKQDVSPKLPDTTQHHALHLLPENLSPLERVLWGDGGLMRTTGIAPLTRQSRMNELKVRRAMLTAHQLGGYVTLGLLIPTIIQGQKDLQNWNDATNGLRPFDRSIHRSHKSLGEWTFISYMTTASLGLFSPPPLIRRDDWDTVKWHKTLAWIHFTGMIALPILGSMAFHAKSIQEAKTLRTIHQVTGYTTAAAFSLSMIVLTF